MNVDLRVGDSLEVLKGFASDSVDSIVCDPPYGLSFMGKKWDYDVPSVALWREAMRVLKPGGHLLAFSSSRTYHRMTCAIEDAGFEVRDQIMWLYGSGFPKSLDVSKAIDKAAGAEREVIGVHKRHGGGSADSGSMSGPLGTASELPLTAPATDAARQWQGWGTALKPAHEPICVARKPLIGTVVENVLTYGTGSLNINGCRVEGGVRPLIKNAGKPDPRGEGFGGKFGSASEGVTSEGRWPANVIHDGSDEVVAAFPQAPGQQGDLKATGRPRPSSGRFGDMAPPHAHVARVEDDKSAARFFYCAKASKKDRGEGNTHPTVKPTDLMRYLCRLVTPPGGVVLDPFMGSGSTGKAAVLEGFRFIGIDMDPNYVEVARKRIEAVIEGDK